MAAAVQLHCPYVARVFLPRAIYENIDIMFMELYGIH
jgi:hypothetical protein